ncbi:MAG TPA: hypothetical protein VHZ03_22640, partial [Trebonia sp.]|nr:hypothetical protein [Trebonia sp.]
PGQRAPGAHLTHPAKPRPHPLREGGGQWEWPQSGLERVGAQVEAAFPAGEPVVAPVAVDHAPGAQPGFDGGDSGLGSVVGRVEQARQAA